MTQVIKLIKYGKSNEAFEFQEEEITPPLADEVQIEVSCFGLNYADVMARHGLYGEAPPLPCTLGYEVVGTVIKAGKDVHEDLIEKKVVAFTQFGGYSKQINTKAFGAIPIEDYDEKKALCLATQYVTAYYMSTVATTIHEGDNVLIHAAAGGVGTALIQLVKQKKATIIAKTSQEAKFEYLKALGVHYIVNYKKEDYAQQVQHILGEQHLDVSFNPVAGATFKKDWKLLGNNGRLLLFGGSSLSKKWGIFSKLNFVFRMGIIIPITMMMQSKSLIGVNMLKLAIDKPKVLHHCLKDVVQLALNGEIDPIVGAVYSAKDIAAAHDYLGSGKSTGKVVVEWNKKD